MSDTQRILIVDDEPNVRLVFRTALESSRYSVAAARDGETALRWLKESPTDLVVLDLSMPGLDGMEVLKQLRAEGNDVPVVIVTAHDNVPNAVQAMKLGAIDFLAKPLTPTALRGAVSEVLERHRTRNPVPPVPAAAEPVTAASEFADNLKRAKRALNYRAFDEAEIFLKQAAGLDPHSAEMQNLMGVLHELRLEHEDAYLCYRAALKADKHYEPAKHNVRRYDERFTFGHSAVPIDTGDGLPEDR